MSILIVLLSVIVLLVSYFIYISATNLDFWKKRNVKYLKPLPIIGNMLPVLTKSQSLLEFIYFLYNAFPNERYIGFFQFMSPVLLLRDPELIKSVTIKNFDHFLDHTGFIPEEVDPLWGKNLFSSKGERWRDLRQTLSPVFTSSKMRTMFLLMQECAAQMKAFCINQNKEIIEVELRDFFSRITNDVIASTAFGIKCDSINNKNNEFFESGKELADFTGFKRLKFLIGGQFPKITKFFGIKMINNNNGRFFRNIIDETIKLREEKNVIRPDLIHLLMLSRKGKLKYEDILNSSDFSTSKNPEIKNDTTNIFLTNEDITAQALVFFLGGFDTVSLTACFVSYELAVNPKIQAKLREEVAKTYEQCDGKITYEKLLSMKYLDMVLCESLRKWPQGLFLDRICTKAFEIEPQNPQETALQINVGEVIWIPVYGLHTDPRYFPNPEVFDPERFSEENSHQINSATYMPFGIGPRNCIGSRFALLEIKLLLVYMLSEFEFVTTSKTEIPLKIRRDSAILIPESGFNIALKRSPVY